MLFLSSRRRHLFNFFSVCVAISFFLFYFVDLLVKGNWSNQTWFRIFIAHKRSLRRLCFYRCLSVHGGGVSKPRPRGCPGPSPGGLSRPRPGGGVSRRRPGGCLPRGGPTPPPPSRRLLLRTVRILLECILVFRKFKY